MGRLLISCGVFEREISLILEETHERPDVVFLPQALHELPAAEMKSRIQQVIDGSDAAGYSEILLAYGLCGGGLAGIRACRAPLVIPRAPDCIPLLFGDRSAHETNAGSHPGTIYRSCGWVEKKNTLPGIRAVSPATRMGMGQSLAEFIAKYGDDNGRYLFELLSAMPDGYDRLVYIRTGTHADSACSREAAAEAAVKQLAFEEKPGNLDWLRLLVTGPWHDAQFTVIPPGTRIISVSNKRIMESFPVP